MHYCALHAIAWELAELVDQLRKLGGITCAESSRQLGHVPALERCVNAELKTEHPECRAQRLLSQELLKLQKFQ